MASCGLYVLLTTCLATYLPSLCRADADACALIFPGANFFEVHNRTCVREAPTPVVQSEARAQCPPLFISPSSSPVSKIIADPFRWKLAESLQRLNKIYWTDAVIPRDVDMAYRFISGGYEVKQSDGVRLEREAGKDCVAYDAGQKLFIPMECDTVLPVLCRLTKILKRSQVPDDGCIFPDSPGWSGSRALGQCYNFVRIDPNDDGNWNEAQNDCFTKHDGSSLAKIYTQEQQDRVVASMEALETPFSFAWIGGYKVNGNFVWNSNVSDPITYSDWISGQPNGGNCIELRKGDGYSWADFDCGWTASVYICSRDPNPE